MNKCFKLDRSDEHYLSEEVYDIIRTIRDPELPKSLEELDVVDPDLVWVRVDETHKWVLVKVVWVPTTPSCGFAMNIALCIRTKLEREFTQREYMKLEIKVQDGKHDTGQAIDKQVNDKERALAAMENETVKAAIEDLIKEREMH